MPRWRGSCARAAAVGLPPGLRRRTPGLRREEVAQLANLGAAWYTALEQGRDIHPSQQVLEGVAGALRLNADERRHLFGLAGQPLSVDSPPARERISVTLARVIEDLLPNPAYVMGRRWDMLAWNRAAGCVFGSVGRGAPHARNVVWWLFTDPLAPSIYDGWDELARAVLAHFRADSARYPGDPWFAGLIDDLRRESAEFRAWWPQHDVLGAMDGRKVLRHPTAGLLEFEHTTLLVAANPNLQLMVYTPAVGTATAARVQRLLDAATAR